MRYTGRQGGSVKVFIIVGIILALIALGVLYGVKRLAMNDQTPPLNLPTVNVANNNPEKADKSNNTNRAEDSKKGSETDKQSDSTKTDSENKDSANKDEATKSDAESNDSTEATKSESTQSTSSESSASGSTTNGSVNTGTHSSGEDLPQSGPAENYTALTFAILTVSSVAYIRSLRRQ